VNNTNHAQKQIWNTHLRSEISFWEAIINGTFSNKEWVQDWKTRAAGIDIIPSYLHKYITDGARILDVGSGPATTLGGIFNGRHLDITAVDPLASQYMELFQKYDAEPLVKTIYAEGENLTDSVNGKFSFVYSRNALDHSWHPIKAMQSMIDICSPGGAIFFENFVNEGYRENYEGLHQWNFMEASGDLVVWKQDGKALLISKELKGYRSIHVSQSGQWVIAEILV
jgi:SAM-dependent methyltransferase